MKKLMVMLAAGFLAVCANAASVNWVAQKGYIYDGAGDSATKLTSGTAYLVMATYAQDDLVSLFAGNNENAAATLTALQGNSAYVGSGAIESNARISAGTGTTSATDSFSAYFVIFNDDKMFISATTDSTYDGLAQSHELAFASVSTASKAFNDVAGGYTGAGWYGAAAVPEPTSGLLMLLGMAGLALRRKRA